MNLRITAWLSGELAGHPPHLDSLLILQRALALGLPELGRADPCPAVDAIPIPIETAWLGGHQVYRVSAPILCGVSADQHVHLARRFPSEHPALLHLTQQGRLLVGGGEWKSYLLPIRTRTAQAVVWFAVGDLKAIQGAVGEVSAIGKKTAIGFGRVLRWEVEEIETDWSWYALSEAGPVLMRHLPQCAELPAGLLGAVPDYASCQPPYWHPERWMEIVSPC